MFRPAPARSKLVLPGRDRAELALITPGGGQGNVRPSGFDRVDGCLGRPIDFVGGEKIFAIFIPALLAALILA
jgi:hypothetical protein